MLGCLPRPAAQTRDVGIHVAVAGSELSKCILMSTLATRVHGIAKKDGRGVHCAKTLLYDSVFYSVYLNIHLKYTHQRIEPYTQVRIFKYNRSRDICGCLANR